ncbi:MAG: hypothetical protein SGPRY_005198 [Prymnesium sp.]
MDWQNNSSAPLSSLYVMLQLAAIEEWQSQHANVQCPASGPKAKTAEIIGPSLAHEIRVSSESSAGCLGSSTNQSRTRVNRGSAARPATTSASVHVLRGNEIYPRTSVACPKDSNGIAERYVGLVFELVQVLLLSSGAPLSFCWGSATLHATDILNRILHTGSASLAPPDQTAYELLTLLEPSILELPPFGCRANVVGNHTADATLSPRALRASSSDAVSTWLARIACGCHTCIDFVCHPRCASSQAIFLGVSPLYRRPPRSPPALPPAPPQPGAVLYLFSAAFGRAGGLAWHLAGFGLACDDVDGGSALPPGSRHGGGSHDLLDDGVYARVREHHPDGLTLPASHHAEFQRANRLTERLCGLLFLAHQRGVQFVVENPVPRHDKSYLGGALFYTATARYGSLF